MRKFLNRLAIFSAVFCIITGGAAALFGSIWLYWHITIDVLRLPEGAAFIAYVVLVLALICAIAAAQDGAQDG